VASLGEYGTSDEMVAHICEQLADEFTGTFSPETIKRFVAESFDSLSNAPVQAFVPLFIHRFAKERLRAAGQAEGVIVKEVPEVLSVYVHNAGRSQMAAALLIGHRRGWRRSVGAALVRAGRMNGRRIATLEVGIEPPRARFMSVRQARPR
jgi:protein-tyrosine phosphatase-like protein